ncbi:MAG: SDR family oxidoreductase [Actinobacteria bacterium]|nr:MAG: SDR family oxidoreductase [Actinomycetota bacterium]
MSTVEPLADLDWGSLLDGKAALITGAGSGQGRAAAQLFARHGARVVVADFADTIAAETVAAIQDDGGEAIAFHADVSRRADCDAMVASTFDTYGRIDVLYNNAAIQTSGRLLECTEDEWDVTIATNLSAIFWACRAAIPLMLAGDGGSIINTASVVGYVGGPGYAAYGPAKAGLVTLTRQMALEYGPKVRANIIAPGGIDTPRFRKAHEDEPDYDAYVARLTSGVPLRRLGHPDDVARIALFLASDASSYVSGAVIPADGGMAARR